MVTSRFRWLFTLSVAGTLLGLLRGQELLALIGLSLLMWLLVGWLLFRIRLLIVSRTLTCVRTINGSTQGSLALWSGRPLEVQVQVSSNSLFPTPLMRLTDYLSDKLELVEHSNQRDGSVSQSTPWKITYTCKPRAAGSLQFKGVCLQLFDREGLFFARAFVPCQQQFRVLPMPVTADSPRPHMKLSSALPPPGIHRLQKAGMGGELLDLREYQPGDPPKSIAWKVSARRDCLMIRQHESEVPIRTTLMVDHSQSTRCGAFGWRPIDQLTVLAATIAQGSLAVRDPVGLNLIDEHTATLARHGGGNRQYYRLLDQLSRAAAGPVTVASRLSEELIQQAHGVACDLHPHLMQRRVNRVPFFLFPLGPAARYQHGKRVQLSALFTELYDLPATQAVNMLFDHALFAEHLQQFLSHAGCSLMPRLTAHEELHREKVNVFTGALLSAVAHGRDNEVFVLLADLLDHPHDLGRLPHAIRVAAARHHRVIVICPWPDWLGPRLLTPSGPHPEPLGLEQMLYEGERIRLSEVAIELARMLRRAGASVAFAADPKVTQMVLAQADLVRSGRISAV